MRFGGNIAVLGLAVVLVTPLAAWGAGPMGRRISDIPGMPMGITDVGQDRTGYLWISSNEGLHRYDGFEIRSWGAVPGRFTYVATGPTGEVVGGAPLTGLYRVDGKSLRRVPAPELATERGPQHAVFDRRGRLWVAWDGRLLRREGETWVDVGGDEVGADQALSLARRESGGVFVGSRTGDVWLVDAEDRPRRIAEGLGGWVMQVHDDPFGPVATVRTGPRPGLVRVTDAGVVQLLDWPSRADGLARLGSTWWIAYPTGVWAVRDDGTKEFLTANEGFAGFGALATDREGGLWSASVRGLSHYPQPDTRLWTELSGLPHVSLRSIHAVPEGHLVTGWEGPLLLDAAGRARPLDLGDLFSWDRGCADPWGGVWMKAYPRPPSRLEFARRERPETMLVQWWDGAAHVRRRHGRWYRGDVACDVGPDGSFWLMADERILEVTGPGREPTTRGRLPTGTWSGHVQAGLVVLDDRSGIVAAFNDDTTCEAPMPPDGVALRADAWTCAAFDRGSVVLDLHETPAGNVWLAAGGGGVYERSEEGWQRISGGLAELGEAIAIEPARPAGVWVVGWRERWRVEERDSGEPPIVAERLGTAHGVPDWQNGYGLLETDDGTVWVPMFPGLARVPASVRRVPPSAPSVTITRLVADGREVTPGERLELRHGGHALEVRWSALSFRDPTRVRYRMRLEDDAGWSVLSQPFVRLAGLRSGRHRLELGASLDGRTWSDVPAAIEFEVRRAWYAQGWFIALLALVTLGVASLVFRLRLAHLLRLERQRTRIAMDLHDEMGAGLGSAGLLVGLLGEAELDEDERRRIGERAAQQIRDLGAGLGDIVWSLRPGTETLDALLLFLRQRAGDLFPAGGHARVTVDAPDPCPALRLALPLRRNLQWIAVEALHNAARHSGARRVVIRLRPDADAWVLSIRDDGRGFDDDDDPGAAPGMGRESMRRRADEIGADLVVRSVPGEGTDVSVRFRPGRGIS